MTSALDRQQTVELVNEAHAAGARLKSACAEVGIGVNTYRRWAAGGHDKRPDAVRPKPAKALSDAERQAVLDVCHQPEFASLPPAQIVARLADQGTYLASESTFYRILHDANEQHHRGRMAPPRQPGPPPRHRADGPLQTWTWDVTYLPTAVRSQFYYLYMIIDIYSRKIVDSEVFASENANNSSILIRRAVLREQCCHAPPKLHADNGSAMKGATLLATLQKLEIKPSFSRPRVSNDNAFSEAMFRTCKYRPDYPTKGFESLEAAREWVHHFVQWYNHEHRHSGIRYVTPDERHRGLDHDILARRHQLYQAARAANPERWSGDTRNWTPVGPVWLNPEIQNDPRASLEAA